jgi:hypothetical protein
VVPNLFNTTENTNYARPPPDVSYYGVDKMNAWYETVAKTEVFDNRRVLERYCQADETVLR